MRSAATGSSRAWVPSRPCSAASRRSRHSSSRSVADLVVRGSTDPDLTRDPYGSPDKPLQDERSLVLSAIESVQSFHKRFTDQVERRYRSYRGIAEKKRDKTQGWRSNLTTPYILQVVEGMIATLLDAKPSWEVTPKPLAGEQISDILGRQSSSRLASAALQWAMDEDQFPLKQRPFIQQDLIASLSVAKVVWAYECREVTRLAPMEIELIDDFGVV